MSLRNIFVNGVKWSFIQQIATQVINYASIFWLAILLVPEDFGKVALVVVLVGVFESINGFGVGQLIVRDNVTDPKLVSTYFWLVLFLSLLLTAFCLAAGIAYGLLFKLDDPVEFLLLVGISASALIVNGVISVFSALYSRDMNFKLLSQYFIVSLFLGNGCAIWVGYMGLGYWALVVKNILPGALLFLCFLIAHDYRIQFHFGRTLIRSTWSFTSNVTYFNALNFLVRNLDYIIIGKFFDLNTVGQYSIAYKIMIFPMKNITARIQAVLYPLLTRMKDDLRRVERTYSVVTVGISYITFPLAVLVSSLAVMWVPLFFDVGKYDRLITLVQVLSVVGAVQSITSPVMSLYLVSDRTQVLLYMGLISALINGIGFWLGGISNDIHTFALIYAGIQLIVLLPLSNYIPFRFMRFNFFGFLQKIAIPLVASFCAYVVAILVGSEIGWSVYPKMLAVTGLTLASYVLVLFVLSGGEIVDQLKQARAMLIQK
jgi:PST family polysaccharide transporter